jgi:hypothetical protein
MIWVFLNPRMTPDHLGFLPGMMDDTDPRPAAEQIDSNYTHGGGWHPQSGFTLGADNSLSYPGDPILRPQAMTQLRHETIVFYQHDILAIIQPDRSFEACRVD